MAELDQIRAELFSMKDEKKAEISKRYLKSDYAFYGVTVPELRKIAKKFKHLSIYDTYNLFDELWNSNNHEEMSLALYLLGNFKKQFSLETWDFLMKSSNRGIARIEKAKSWDHIDEISSHITGEIFLKNPNLQQEIKNLSNSRNPWLRRLSIVSQYPLIKNGKIQLTILLAEKLVYDDNIYVQKGAGWMLREAGKKNPSQIREFVKLHKDMKAAALSYATEKMLEVRKLVKEQLKEEKEHGKIKIFDSNNTSEKTKTDIHDNKNLSSELEKIKHFKNYP